MVKRPMKYNPAFLSDEELIDAFVVRQTELDLLLQVLRENTAESNQHVLLIGPRGIGKTMLVLRVAAEARRAADLRDRWYPLVFAEESYQACTAGEFWLEALFHLAEQTKDARRRRAYEELREEGDEVRLRERALAQLMDFADAQGKRILLIVENLNMLLGDQLSDDDAWALRHTLLHEPRVMLLATAASRFAEIENAGMAMFDLFRLHELHPVEEDDCARIWASIAEKEVPDGRIRPIQILTGGNPRLLAIISYFGADMSFRELMTDLVHLVDEHTEYFKSHLDGLPAVERKVYVALVELWDPATAREVADSARLDVSKTSTLLSRLAGRGAVLAVDEGPRKKRYQVAERMYNIYYLMRRRGSPAARVKAVVHFMVSLYGPRELVGLVRGIAEEASRLAPELRQDHYFAFEAMLRQALELAKDPDRVAEAEELCRQALVLDPASAPAYAVLGLLHERLERYDEAEKAYRKAIDLRAEGGGVAGSAACVAPAAESAGAGRVLVVGSGACAPDDAHYQDRLSSVLSVMGKCDEALEAARRYLGDADCVKRTTEDAVELFANLAAAGSGREALRVLVESPSAEILEPLIVGLRLFLGEDVKVAAEILEVGKDVAKRIEQRREELRAERDEEERGADE